MVFRATNNFAEICRDEFKFLDEESAKAMLLSKAGLNDWDDYKVAFFNRIGGKYDCMVQKSDGVDYCKTSHCVHNKHLSLVCLAPKAGDSGKHGCLVV